MHAFSWIKLTLNFKNPKPLTDGMVQIHHQFFFIWTNGEEKLKEFMADFDAFNPDI